MNCGHSAYCVVGFHRFAEVLLWSRTMNTILLRTCCCASLGLGFCFDSRRESDFMHTVFPGVVDGVIHMITVVSLSPHCSVSGVGLVLALAFLINLSHAF